jgi:hypothetical protein
MLPAACLDAARSLSVFSWAPLSKSRVEKCPAFERYKPSYPSVTTLDDCR